MPLRLISLDACSIVSMLSVVLSIYSSTICFVRFLGSSCLCADLLVCGNNDFLNWAVLCVSEWPRGEGSTSDWEL